MPDFEVNPIIGHSIPQLETDYGASDFADVPRPRSREGLPPKFRMRHASHYVEQVMGDAPIQTVRQLPLDQLEGAEADADLGVLVASVREVGLLQPLLVAARGDSRFEVVAGVNRLAAARQAGLSTVPCLVINADQAGASRLRAHAGLRAVVERPVQSAVGQVTATAQLLPTTLAEISESMRFIDGLIAMVRSDESGGRASLLVDAIRVEGDRATTLARAATLVTRADPAAFAPIDSAALLDSLRASVDIAGRLRGVGVQWAASIRLAETVADPDALRTGWAALIHAMFAVARSPDRLEISLTAPRVRPALILEVALHHSGAIDVDEFLQADRHEQHPAGAAGAILVSAALRSARVHRGRLSGRTTDTGFALTFVVPQPLELF